MLSHKAKKRGKALGKLKEIMNILNLESQLPSKNRNHKVRGDYIGYLEYHIEPGRLLVYKKT